MDRENGKRYLSHLGSLLFIAVLLSGFVGAADEANKREGKFLCTVTLITGPEHVLNVTISSPSLWNGSIPERSMRRKRKQKRDLLHGQ